MAGESSLIKTLLQSLAKQRPDAMKRARSMGFDTRNVYFHGTDQPISEFHPNVYVAKDPTIAEGYARKREYDPVQLDFFKPNPAPNIMPMFAKKGSVEQTNRLADYYKVFDPTHLRSVFADFNPEHSESADLMKSHGGSAKSPAWTRKEGKNPEGGLNEKGRASLRAAGHDIKRPQPEGGARKDSFCARMKGMKAKLTSSETANDPDSRINKSLRKWNCHADGGAIDIARQYRETGGKTDSEAYRKAMEDAIKRRQEKALRGDDEDIPQNDPRRFVTPYEYRRGNLGFGTYALANGGRARLADGGDPTQAYVQSLYQNVMGRPGEQSGVDYWTNQLKSGDVTQPEVLQSFAQSNEFKNLYNTDPAKAVSALYQTALGRAPEQSGLDYWTGQAKSGLDLGKMVSGFTGSQEGQNVQSINQLYQNWLENMPSQQQLKWAQDRLARGDKLSQLEMDISRSPEVMDYNNRAWLSGLYQDVLGRAPDKEGLDYWAEQLNSGKTSWSDVAGALQGTEEAKNYDAQNAVPYQVAGPSVRASVTYPTYRELDPESVQNVISGMSGKDIPNVARYIQDAPELKYDNSRLRALPMTQNLANKYLGNPEQAKNIDWSNSVAFVRALEQAGIPQQAAIAIAGNAGVESALGQYGTQKWDVREAGGKGPGVGTLQFTYPSRKKDFQRIAQDYGGTNTLAGNVAAIANEMKNPEYAKIIKTAANAPDLRTASDIIARYYENPKRSALYETAPMRAAMAEQILPQYQAYAAKYPYSPPPLPPKIVDVALPPNRPDQTILDQLTQTGAGGNVTPAVLPGTAPPNGNPLPGASVVSPIPGSGVSGWTPQSTGMPSDAKTIFQQMQDNAYMNYIGQTLNGQGVLGYGNTGGGFATGNTGGISSGPSGMGVSFGNPMGWKNGGAVDIARSYRKAGGPVWDKPRPKHLGKPEKLSPSEKSSAKAAAKAAGRPYPNLVDNMRAAREDGGSLRPLMEAKIEEIGDTELGKYGIGPKAPASTKDELKAGPEQSTWEKIASKAMGDRPSPERRRFVEGAGNIADVAHLGSYATPLAPYVGAADFARGVASGDPMEAALGATGLPGKGAKAVGVAASTMMPESAEAGPLAKALNAIRAYHGSPHKFDKFDISKIGTGEGAQAYGHGLYFAKNENVARNYLGDPEARYRRFSGHMDPREEFAFDIATNSSEPRDMDIMMPLVKKYGSNIDFDEAQKLATNAIKNRGHMYEVDIHADPSHMLDFDRPIKDQPAYEKLKKHWDERVGDPDIIAERMGINPETVPGGGLYQRLAGYRDKANEASSQLLEAGIPGIKYLDQGSRAAGEGTSNYVVFDPSIIEILRRYKEGGRVEAAGGGAMTKFLRELAEQYRPHYDPAARVMGQPRDKWLSAVKLGKPIEEMSVISQGHRPMVAEKFISPSELEGKALITGLGDRTPAGYELTGINDRVLSSPVNMMGGPAFARDIASQGPDKSVWASALSRAQALANKSREAEKKGLEPVFSYVAQGPESGDFSHHMLDAILGQMDRYKMDPKLAEFLDMRMRTAQTGSGETFAPKPGWVGVGSEEAAERMRQRADERVKLIKLMDAAKFRDAPGFPDVGATRFATTDPAVMFDPAFSAGKSFMSMKPGEVVKEPAVSHPSYTTHIPAAPGGHGYMGRFEYELPPELHFKKYREEEIKPELRGKPLAQQTMSILKQVPTVEATPEWVDTASEWQDLMTSLYGKRSP